MLTNTSSKRSPWFLETTSLLQEMSPKRGGAPKSATLWAGVSKPSRWPSCQHSCDFTQGSSVRSIRPFWFPSEMQMLLRHHTGAKHLKPPPGIPRQACYHLWFLRASPAPFSNICLGRFQREKTKRNILKPGWITLGGNIFISVASGSVESLLLKLFLKEHIVLLQ